jgi:aspartyl-tRNA synthetase
MMRTRNAGSLRKSDAGKIVTLAGWVARRRDHGGVAFIDLRDASGWVQVVIRDENVAGALRAEWCVQITGEVLARPAGNDNSAVATGEIEVMADRVQILSEAAPLPFPVDSGDEANISEEVRLKYRYLDLRRRSSCSQFTLAFKGYSDHPQSDGGRGLSRD